MNRSILHTQIRHRLDDLAEKHQELASRQEAIPATEMNQFLAEIKLVYELALSLHHHNALKSMEDLELAIASRFTEKGENVQSETVTETPSAKTMDEVLVDSINKVEESKNSVLPTPMKITGEIHDKFEHSTSIAEQYKEPVTLAESVASKQSTARLAETIKHARINDLLSAIGINERFYYIQHLFGGNAGIYHITLEKLNKESNHKAALSYLETEVAPKFGWDMTSQAVINFKELIERKFLT
ncbi:MAG: hypothetical protein ACKOQ6_03580 [Bacteroidota bacterium]